MKNRSLIGALTVTAACMLGSPAAFAGDETRWNYLGEHGPDHWGALDKSYSTCAAGSQQSPVNLTGAIEAELPSLAIDWKTGGKMLNTGHTIQIEAAGGTLRRGDDTYELLQYHVHAPSEHQVDGRSFPLEIHFVHKHPKTGALGVLGVFVTPGSANAAFGKLAAAFPLKSGEHVAVSDLNPADLLPSKLGYWAYEGSLTTPPCNEIVDWMVAAQPIEAAKADIDKFTAIYAMNARPVLAANRRFILRSN